MIVGREKEYDFQVLCIFNFFIEKYTLIRYNRDM